jgi:hypothetical protein
LLKQALLEAVTADKTALALHVEKLEVRGLETLQGSML